MAYSLYLYQFPKIILYGCLRTSLKFEILAIVIAVKMG